MKNTKSIKKINKSIKKRNSIFDNASPEQKRVMIAQDVLDQIKAKRYIAKSGTWVDPQYNRNVSVKNTDSVQKLFADNVIEKCDVCALGGMFMSCTNLNNNVSVKTLNNINGYNNVGLGDRIKKNTKLPNELNRIFSKDQLTLIEIYFEGGSGWFLSDDDDPHVFNFFEQKTATQRLVAIMKNIIKNNGTFVPSKLKI